MKCDLECDFHDCDKMPKHVEMVRTKCQPKIWDGQNANHRDRSGQNANLWLALCLVGILSGWHFVRTPGLVLINILQVCFRLEQVSERCHHPAVMEEHNHLEKITLKTLSAFLHADTVEAIGSVMQVLKIFLCNLSVMSTTEMCALLRPI